MLSPSQLSPPVLFSTSSTKTHETKNLQIHHESLSLRKKIISKRDFLSPRSSSLLLLLLEEEEEIHCWQKQQQQQQQKQQQNKKQQQYKNENNFFSFKNEKHWIDDVMMMMMKKKEYEEENLFIPSSFNNKKNKSSRRTAMILRTRGGGGGTIDDNDKNYKKKSLWERYTHFLETSPYLANSLSAAVVAALGDFLSQSILMVSSSLSSSSFSAIKFDYHRFLTFIILGLYYFGPCLQLWYNVVYYVGRLLDHHYTSSWKKPYRLLILVLFHQTIGAVLINGCFFYFYTLTSTLILHKSFYGVWKETMNSLLGSDKFIRTMKINWIIWPLASYINFGYIPESQRVLFANGVAVIFNICLSTIATS